MGLGGVVEVQKTFGSLLYFSNMLWCFCSRIKVSLTKASVISPVLSIEVTSGQKHAATFVLGFTSSG